MITLYHKQLEATSLIKLAQNTMQENYGRLLNIFLSENLLLGNDLNEQYSKISGCEHLPIKKDTMNVSSAGWIVQSNYVPFKEIKNKTKRFYNYPMCSYTTNVCNGYRLMSCKHIISEKLLYNLKVI